MNKYLGLGLLLLASSACSKDTIEQPQQVSEAREGITIDIETKQPEFVDLDASLRTMSSITVNDAGYPVVKLLETFTNAQNRLSPIDVRWRYVNIANPNTLPTGNGLLPDGLIVSNGPIRNGNTNYSASMGEEYGKAYAKTITEGGKQKVRLFLPYGAAGTPWWADEQHDVYVFISTGLNAARTSEVADTGSRPVYTTGRSRVKMYYTGAYGTNPNKMFSVGAWDNGPTVENTESRKVVVADANNPYEFYFPYMTSYRKVRRAVDANAAAGSSATYGFAALDHGVLEPRGTILSFNFKNETGSQIQVTDVELKNDAFAYDGYFSGAGEASAHFAPNTDGIAPEGVMTGEEVQAQQHLKFVETNLGGYSQYTLDALKQANPNVTYPGIPTSASYGIYANSAATSKGITIEPTQKSGRIFLWGYPKNGGKTALRVKVTYTINGGAPQITYQRVVAPAEGFQEGKAYLKTIRVK